MTLERTDNVLHLWRLSDLSLLATLELPPLPSAEGPECSLELIFMGEDCSPARVAGHDRPFEIRTLPDGSAILNTIACGFYRIHAMDTDEPQIDVLMNWPETVGCAVPTMVGKFEVLPNMVTNEIVTLDVLSGSGLRYWPGCRKCNDVLGRPGHRRTYAGRRVWAGGRARTGPGDDQRRMATRPHGSGTSARGTIRTLSCVPIKE